MDRPRAPEVWLLEACGRMIPNEMGVAMFRACMFDLDGTLVNSLADLASSCNHALAQQGLPTHATDEYRRFVGRGIAKLIGDVLPEHCKTAETLETTRELFDEHYDVHCLDHTQPYDGIGQLLSGLGDYGCAVVSNKPDLLAKRIVSALFGNRFDVVMGQREGVALKPDPTGPLEACSLMGVRPAQCLFLGDSGVDMVTARTAGMFPAGALWGFRTRHELVESGARALLEAPQDLLAVLRAPR